MAASVWLFHLSALTQLCGMLYFLAGFMPMYQNNLSSSSLNGTFCNKEQFHQAKKGNQKKLILMVVDAMREDFVFDGDRMPYTQSLIRQNKTFSFVAKCLPPTVTLSRIKSIVTGAIPEFIDVVMNFASKELNQDNIIARFNQKGKRIVFFGDDTWMKMFPGCFLRSDGTTSFVVSDYTEVDNNVTRHLDFELAQFDWDVMILHFLGLDHIGHSHGAHSPLIENKLSQMDQVIHKIMLALTERRNKTNEESIFILTSDHGMNEAGGHGGATNNEIRTPLVFTSPEIFEKSGEMFTRKEVNQLDIAATISALFDQGIPRQSIGAVITDVLKFVPYAEMKKQIHNNLCQLGMAMQRTGIYDKYRIPVQSCCDNVNECLVNETLEFMLTAIQQYSHLLQRQFSGYKSDDMAKGIVLLAISLSLSIFSFASFNYHLLISSSKSVLNWWMFSSIILHSLSLASTSFIEEEHQFWYFIITTSLLVIMLIVFREKDSFPLRAGLANCNGRGSLIVLMKFLMILTLLRILRVWNQSGVKWLGRADISQWLLLGENKIKLCVLVLVSLASIFYFCFWSSEVIDNLLSFIAVASIMCYKIMHIQGHWLLSPNGVLEARFVLLTCIGICINTVRNFSYPTQSVFSNEDTWFVLSTVAMKKVTGFIRFPFRLMNASPFSVKVKSDKILHRKESRSQRKTHNEGYLRALLVIYLLVLRPNNIPWIGFVTAVAAILNDLWHHCLSGKHMDVSLIIFCYTLGKASFHSQGLSNALSSVDVSAGLIGMSYYMPIYAGFLVVMATYGCHVFWLHFLLKTSPVHRRNARDEWTWSIKSTYNLLFAIESLVFCIITYCNRYHLFVWTVFAPKVLVVFSLHAAVSLVLYLL